MVSMRNGGTRDLGTVLNKERQLWLALNNSKQVGWYLEATNGLTAAHSLPPIFSVLHPLGVVKFCVCSQQSLKNTLCGSGQTAELTQ